jgi:hypothetical protein
MTITEQAREFESFDSFFAGLPAEKERDAIVLYEEYIRGHISQLILTTRKDMAERIEQAMPLSFNGVKLLSFEKGYNAYHTEALEAILKIRDERV